MRRGRGAPLSLTMCDSDQAEPRKREPQPPEPAGERRAAGRPGPEQPSDVDPAKNMM